MTSTSTESAWGPHDWSSHGGGGSWPEPAADLAPAPGPDSDPQGLRPGDGEFGAAEFEGPEFGDPASDRLRSEGSGRRRAAFGEARADDRRADTGSGFGGFDADGPGAHGLRSEGSGRRRGAFGEARAGADNLTDTPARERGARGRRSGDAAEGRASASRRGSGRAFGDASREGLHNTPTDPASRARDICLRLLTGSARTRKQLADALRRKEIPEEIAEQVLDRLTEVGLIDDAAYARSWVEQRQRSRGLARRALAGELRAKGVDSALVAEAVAEVDPDDEEAAARRLVDRKLGSTRGLDRQVRLRRLAGMLARRGYPEGLALRVVRAALDAEGEDGSDEDAGDMNYLDSGED